MDAATIAFGQGMSSTTLQLAMAMGALANRGRLMEPILVKQIVDPQGQVLRTATPQLRRQVVPESVARLLTDMMIGVTGEDGTGTEAAVEGHLVAGKTGTAQKADYVHGGYTKDKWTSSFVGYAPAQKPRLLLAVVIDEPMIAHHGGMVAGPVFRRVMEASLRHLGVAADINGTLAEQVKARREEQAKIAVRLKAAAPPMAAGPTPPSAEGAQVGADAEPSATAQAGAGELYTPDLVGQNARVAIARARAADLQVRVFGSGLVSEQEPAARSVIVRGSTLTLRLRAPGAAVADEQPDGEPTVQPVAPKPAPVELRRKLPAAPRAAAERTGMPELAGPHAALAVEGSGGRDG